MEQTTQPHKKRALVGILTGATALFLLLTAFTAKNGSDKSSVATNGETLHRESTVTRGDLTVGVTESITAALKVHNISFDFTLTSSSGSGNQNASTAIGIEEVYVKAGQRVKAGDPLVLLSSGDIQEAINQLQSDYQEAVVSLTKHSSLCKRGGWMPNIHQRLLCNLEQADDELYHAQLEYEEIGNTNLYEDAYETQLTEEDDIEKPGRKLGKSWRPLRPISDRPSTTCS